MRLLVVGSGAAGHTAAFEARKIDPSFSITIFSEDGLPLYSPCLIPQYLASHLSRERIFLKNPEDYSRAKIDFIHKKVTRIDLQNQVIHADGGTLPYDRIILAIGGHAKKPTIDGIDKKGVFSLKTLEDSTKILAHLAPQVAVIGSGNIGIETALALNSLGCKVTLFEIEATVNPIFFPPPFSDPIQKSLESEGIEVVTGVYISQILGRTRAEGLVDRGRVRRFGLIINATGIVPNTEIAGQAGLTIGPKGGILVDGYMKTSNPFVFACGDCVELSGDEDRVETTLGGLWPNAIHQGRVAGYNAANKPKKHNGLFNFRILKIKDSFAISLGWNEKDLAMSKEIVLKDDQPFSGMLTRVYFKQGRLVAARLWGKAWRLGPFITCIQREWKMNMFFHILQNRKAISRYPFLGQLKFFFY